MSLVGVLAGVPGVAAARLLSGEMSAASEQTQAFELGSVGSASAEASCSGHSGTSVTVRWNENRSDLVDGFEILRSDAGGQFVNVGVVSIAGAAQFSDDGVASGSTYTYAVRAMNSAWNGSSSTTVPVTIPPCN